MMRYQIPPVDSIIIYPITSTCPFLVTSHSQYTFRYSLLVHKKQLIKQRIDHNTTSQIIQEEMHTDMSNMSREEALASVRSNSSGGGMTEEFRTDREIALAVISITK